ncbi:MAG: AAA family ATPase [Kofleriaceae bacterium]
MIEPPPAAAPRRRKLLVMYAAADEPFARGYLAPALGLTDGDDRAAGLALSAAELARRPMLEVEALLAETETIVPVLSPAYLADPWLLLSESVASHIAVDGESSVVPLVLRACELPVHLQACVSLDFRDAAAWDEELERLQRHLAQPPAPPQVLACPYPGMRPYQASDAPYFFGREREIAELLERLRDGARELYVIGPSGSGKSSLIAAGLVPRLLDEAAPGSQLVRAMRPGRAPNHQLLRSLGARPRARTSDPAGTEGDAASSTPPRLLPGGEAATEAALAELLARQPTASLLLVIDQAEELFTQCDAAELRQFTGALRALRAQGRCQVIFTLRADFFAELLQSDLWIEGSRSHLDLPALRGAELQAAIEAPARSARVFLEPELVQRLLADGSDQPGVLPLLQEVLVALWERRRHRLLTLADYLALGEGSRSGLAVAVAERADQTLRELPAPRAAIARRVLLRLVSFGEGRPDTRQRQTFAALRADEPREELSAVLEALSIARLIIMDGAKDEAAAAAPAGASPAGDALDPRDDDRVDLCHDVLITAWPAFAQWVDARRAAERQRRALQASAEQWARRGGGLAGLLDVGELAGALAWRRDEGAAELGESPLVTALIEASQRELDAARRRRVRRSVIAVSVLGAAALLSTSLAIVAALQTREAVRQGRLAEENGQRAERALADTARLLASQYQETGRRLLLEGHPQRALPYLVAAREQGADGSNLRWMFRAASATRPRFAVRHGNAIAAIARGAGEARLLTINDEGEARLWDARTGAPVATLPRHVRTAALHQRDDLVVTLEEDGVVRLWAPPWAAGAPLRAGGPFSSADFSADGAHVFTRSAAGALQLWTLAGVPHGPAHTFAEPPRYLRVSPDGAKVIVFDSTSLATVVDLRGGRPLRVGIEGGPRPSSASFRSDGKKVAVAFAGAWVTLLDTDGAHLPKDLDVRGMFPSVVFAPRGALLAVNDDHGISVLDTEGTAPPRRLEHPSLLLAVGFSEDARRVFTLSQDHVTRVWDLSTQEVIFSVESEANAASAALSSDGETLYTGDLDGAVRAWPVRPPARPAELSLGARGRDVAFSPDGKLLAISSESGLRLWDPATLTPLASLPLPPAGAWRLRWSRDSRFLLNASLLEDLTVWDGSTHARVLSAPGREVPLGIHGRAREPFDFAPDGSAVAASLTTGRLQVWELPSGRPRFSVDEAHQAEVSTVRFAADGRRLISASVDGTARVWDAATGAPIGEPLRHRRGDALTAAAFSPDARVILTASRDGTARLWDATRLTPRHDLAHHGAILGAEFCPDSACVATYGEDDTARIWEVSSGELRFPPLEHGDWVTSLGFSADGARLYTIAHEARIWDAVTGGALSPPLRHVEPEHVIAPYRSASPAMFEERVQASQEIWRAAFRPDGQRLLTVGRSLAARAWNLDEDRGTLEDWRAINALGAFSPVGVAGDPRTAPPSGFRR